MGSRSSAQETVGVGDAVADAGELHASEGVSHGQDGGAANVRRVLLSWDRDSATLRVRDLDRVDGHPERSDELADQLANGEHTVAREELDGHGARADVQDDAVDAMVDRWLVRSRATEVGTMADVEHQRSHSAVQQRVEVRATPSRGELLRAIGRSHETICGKDVVQRTASPESVKQKDSEAAAMGIRKNRAVTPTYTVGTGQMCRPGTASWACSECAATGAGPGLPYGEHVSAGLARRRSAG